MIDIKSSNKKTDNLLVVRFLPLLLSVGGCLFRAE